MEEPITDLPGAPARGKKKQSAEMMLMRHDAPLIWGDLDGQSRAASLDLLWEWWANNGKTRPVGNEVGYKMDGRNVLISALQLCAIASDYR